MTLMLNDAIDTLASYILFFLMLCGALGCVVVILVILKLAVGYAVRSLRRRFVEGRV